MIRITDDFTLRRVAGQLVASIGPIAVKLTAAQAKKAEELFGIMAAMMSGGDCCNSCEPEETEVLKLEDAA